MRVKVERDLRKRFSLFAILLAFVVLMGLSPSARIASGGVFLMTGHLPVILGALALGGLAGAALGGVFGAILFFSAPAIPASYGATLANPLASILPGVLMGLACGLIFQALRSRRWLGALLAAAGGVFLSALVQFFAIILIDPARAGVSAERLLSMRFAREFWLNTAVAGIFALALAAPIAIWIVRGFFEQSIEPLRYTFQKWLIPLVAALFVILMGVCYSWQTDKAERDASALFGRVCKQAETYLESGLAPESIARELLPGREGLVLLLRGDEILSAPTSIPHANLRELNLNQEVFSRPSAHVRVNDADFYAAARELSGYTLLFLYPDAEMFSGRNDTALFGTILFFMLFACIGVLVSTLVERVVARGIEDTNASLGRITEGNLEERVDVRSAEEFLTLSNRINGTVVALKNAIITAASQIDQELEFARAIQMATLQNAFPPYPERTEFDIFATMQPAKEVGGDFYDFFLIDENRLALVIADVSGKGIPAAMFMMTAKTHIKNSILAGGPLDEAMRVLNECLLEENDAEMFVTAFVAIVDFRENTLTYVNAGHNQPLIRRAGGAFEWLQAKPSLFLACMPGVRYKQTTLEMRMGDALFLYTDGVTEANNPSEELYGGERLVRALNEAGAAGAREIVEILGRDVERFEDGAEPADDITMLSLIYQKQDLMAQAKKENLGQVLLFVEEELNRHACPPEKRAALLVAAEEIFVDIASYAYPKGEGNVKISRSVGGAPRRMTLVFEDSGIPFNPLENPAPDITKPIEEREIGGLGIFLVRKTMDFVDYKNEDGKNILTLQKMFS